MKTLTTVDEITMTLQEAAKTYRQDLAPSYQKMTKDLTSSEDIKKIGSKELEEKLLQTLQGVVKTDDQNLINDYQKIAKDFISSEYMKKIDPKELEEKLSKMDPDVRKKLENDAQLQLEKMSSEELTKRADTAMEHGLYDLAKSVYEKASKRFAQEMQKKIEICNEQINENKKEQHKEGNSNSNTLELPSNIKKEKLLIKKSELMKQINDIDKEIQSDERFVFLNKQF